MKSKQTVGGDGVRLLTLKYLHYFSFISRSPRVYPRFRTVFRPGGDHASAAVRHPVPWRHFHWRTSDLTASISPAFASPDLVNAMASGSLHKTLRANSPPDGASAVGAYTRARADEGCAGPKPVPRNTRSPPLPASDAVLPRLAARSR
jgi:hypothetical protein